MSGPEQPDVSVYAQQYWAEKWMSDYTTSRSEYLTEGYRKRASAFSEIRKQEERDRMSRGRSPVPRNIARVNIPQDKMSKTVKFFTMLGWSDPVWQMQRDLDAQLGATTLKRVAEPVRTTRATR